MKGSSPKPSVFRPGDPNSILEEVEKEATEKFVNDLQSAGLSQSEVKEKLQGPELSRLSMLQGYSSSKLS